MVGVGGLFVSIARIFPVCVWIAFKMEIFPCLFILTCCGGDNGWSEPTDGWSAGYGRVGPGHAPGSCGVEARHGRGGDVAGRGGQLQRGLLARRHQLGGVQGGVRLQWNGQYNIILVTLPTQPTLYLGYLG